MASSLKMKNGCLHRWPAAAGALQEGHDTLDTKNSMNESNSRLDSSMLDVSHDCVYTCIHHLRYFNGLKVMPTNTERDQRTVLRVCVSFLCLHDSSDTSCTIKRNHPRTH